jgi:hypothetical protein
MCWRKAQFGFKIPTNVWGPPSLYFSSVAAPPRSILRTPTKSPSNPSLPPPLHSLALPPTSPARRVFLPRARHSVHLIVPAHHKEPPPSGSTPSSSSSTSLISVTGSVPHRHRLPSCFLGWCLIPWVSLNFVPLRCSTPCHSVLSNFILISVLILSIKP